MKIAAAGTVFFGLSVFLHSIELSSQGGAITKSVQCLHGGMESSYPLIPRGDNSHLSREHLPISEKSRISIMIQGATYILRGPLITDPTYGAWVYTWRDEPSMEERASVYSQKERKHFNVDLHRANEIPFVNTGESECYITEGKNTYYARLYTDGDALGNLHGLSIVRVVALNPHNENERKFWIGYLQRYPKRMDLPNWVQHPQ